MNILDIFSLLVQMGIQASISTSSPRNIELVGTYYIFIKTTKTFTLMDIDKVLFESHDFKELLSFYHENYMPTNGTINYGNWLDSPLLSK